MRAFAQRAPLADASEVEDALSALLINDPALQALLPDGVWWRIAGEDAKRFTVVTLVDHADVPVFSKGRGAERYLFLVEAVMLNSMSTNIKAAAFRIDELLEDGTLEIPGYGFAAMYRVKRTREIEPDFENPDLRWLHRGGQYRVEVGLP